MNVALGADHAGFAPKERIKSGVQELGHQVLDLGTHSIAAVDYPDFAEAVGLAVRDHEADRGMLVCGGGVGASIAAHKIRGVRAGLCHDHYSAHQGVEQDDPIRAAPVRKRVLPGPAGTAPAPPGQGEADRSPLCPAVRRPGAASRSQGDWRTAQ